MTGQFLDAGINHIVILQLENFLSMSRSSEIKGFSCRRKRIRLVCQHEQLLRSSVSQIKHMKKQSNSHESHDLFSMFLRMRTHSHQIHLQSHPAKYSADISSGTDKWYEVGPSFSLITG